MKKHALLFTLILQFWFFTDDLSGRDAALYLNTWQAQIDSDDFQDSLYQQLMTLARMRPDSARTAAQQYLQEELENTPDTLIAQMLKVIGISHYYENDFRASNRYLDSSMHYFRRARDTSGIISSLLNQGNNYFNLGALDSALTFYTDGLDMAIGFRDKKLFSDALLSIGNYYNITGDLQKAEEFYLRFLTISQERDDRENMALALKNLGINFQYQTQNSRGLEYLFKSLKLYEQLDDTRSMVGVLNSIGVIFTENQQYAEAFKYYDRALSLARKINDRSGEALTLGNIGVCYLEKGQLDTALVKFTETLEALEGLQDIYGAATAHFRIGETHERQGNLEEASFHYEKSMALWETMGDPQGIAICLVEIGKLQNEAGRYDRAISNCQKALELAEEVGSLDLQVDCLGCLEKGHKGSGQLAESYAYLSRYVMLHDSLDRMKNAKEVARLGTEYQYEKELLADSLERLEDQLAYQTEITRERSTKRLFLFSGILALIGAVALGNRLVYTRRSRKIIRAEKEKSDNLLLNILPGDVAEELKTKGHADARQFDHTTILFSDFTDFTRISERMTAAELVDEIHYCYKRFDEIVTSHGVEKIKTIGDAYMAAAGLSPEPGDSAYQVILAALEMQEFLAERKEERNAAGLPGFTMRLGIHSGPVVAGIVGIKKFQYDIWGDAVNTAFRLQETGSNGMVNISQSTYDQVKDREDLTFVHRGKISAKNKAEQDMYFVSRAK